MAQAYQLIQAQTLTSTAATVTFSNIPQNYTDLILKVSARSDGADDYGQITFNGSSANFTRKFLIGTGSGFNNNSFSNNSFLTVNPSGYTTNTFATVEYYISNYTGSNNKSINLDAVTENNATAASAILQTVLWSNSAALTSISMNCNTGNFVSGSTFYLYGVGGQRASGGTITADSQYTYHTFTSSGTFTALEKIKNAEVLLVAGGGGGASGAASPGGGAGGVISYVGQTLAAGTSYNAIVGAGGSAGTSGVGKIDGTSGNNSYFGGNSATGGGKGGEQSAAGNGGSGGGGATDFAAGSGIAGQGYNGGRSSSTKYGGGGGGAGGVGLAADSGGANGGPGTSYYSTWHSATQTAVANGGLYYIGGGGGAGANIQFQSGTPSAGGIGGGGSANSTSQAGSGTANTGGGGGGGTSDSSWGGVRTPASGGSGIIIVRYPK